MGRRERTSLKAPAGEASVTSLQGNFAVANYGN